MLLGDRARGGSGNAERRSSVRGPVVRRRRHRPPPLPTSTLVKFVLCCLLLHYFYSFGAFRTVSMAGTGGMADREG